MNTCPKFWVIAVLSRNTFGTTCPVHLQNNVLSKSLDLLERLDLMKYKYKFCKLYLSFLLDPSSKDDVFSQSNCDNFTNMLG